MQRHSSCFRAQHVRLAITNAQAELSTGKRTEERIDRYISGKASAHGQLGDALAARRDEDNRDASLSLHVFQIAEIFGTLKQPGPGLSGEQREHQHHGFFLLTDRLEQASFLVRRLYVEHTKVAIITAFHRGLISML